MGTYYIIHSDELYHHGILGQKWGVRRYQTPSGSLTSAGRARIKSLQKRNAKLSAKIKGRNAKVKAYGESFAKSKRKQKLLIKKAKNERKVAILKPKNQLARDKALMLNKSPGMIGKHRIKQEYRANKRIGKADKKLMAPEIKKKKAALKNFKDKERIKRNNEQVKYLNTPHEGGSTRRYQRAMNRNDAEMAINAYRAGKASVYANRYYRAAAKASNNGHNRMANFYNDRAVNNTTKALIRSKKYEMGASEADKLEKSASKQGYNTTAKNTRRIVDAMAIPTPYGVYASVKTMPGTKYKVRKRR